ncbi:MAG: V-type ATPase subunit [Candidatus Altiarchaeota archaeon]
MKLARENIDSAYLTARIRGLKGRLIEDYRLQELARSRSITDFLGKISDTEYHEELKKTGAKDLHSLEITLLSHLKKRETFILKNSPKHTYQLLKARTSKDEILLIKDLIYSKMEGRGSLRLKDYTFLLGEELWKKHVHLLEAETIEELLTLLKGTRYHKPLKRVREKQEESKPLPYEITLDRVYYETLTEEALKLPEEDRTCAIPLIQEETDHANLLVYLRTLKLDLAFTDYSIPTDSPFNRQLAALDDKKEINRILPLLKPGARIEAIAAHIKSNDLKGLELELTHIVKNRNRKVFHSWSERVDVALAYLKLKEIEVQSVWSIAAGLVNGLPFDRIRQAIPA